MDDVSDSEVGEVDFDFDMSEWMVLDDDNACGDDNLDLLENTDGKSELPSSSSKETKAVTTTTSKDNTESSTVESLETVDAEIKCSLVEKSDIKIKSEASSGERKDKKTGSQSKDISKANSPSQEAPSGEPTTKRTQQPLAGLTPKSAKAKKSSQVNVTKSSVTTKPCFPRSPLDTQTASSIKEKSTTVGKSLVTLKVTCDEGKASGDTLKKPAPKEIDTVGAQEHDSTLPGKSAKKASDSPSAKPTTTEASANPKMSTLAFKIKSEEPRKSTEANCSLKGSPKPVAGTSEIKSKIKKEIAGGLSLKNSEKIEIKQVGGAPINLMKIKSEFYQEKMAPTVTTVTTTDLKCEKKQDKLVPTKNAPTKSETKQELSVTQAKTKPKSEAMAADSGSIAEIMKSVEDGDDKGRGKILEYKMEDISFSGFTEQVEAIKSVPVKECARAGTKREHSQLKEGPEFKKSKMTVSSDVLVHKKAKTKTLKKAKKSQSEGGQQNAKASFGSNKNLGQKAKTQTLPSNTSKSSTVSKSPPAAKPPVKRIIRRFHRSTQTLSREFSNKLLQCLIRIPSLDAPPKPSTSTAVQAEQIVKQDEFLHNRPLPEGVMENVFKVVSTFDVKKLGSRSFTSGSFAYGISMGHVTSADIEKSLFKENVLTKADSYSLFFCGQDYGVVDLFFTDEEKFITVLTQIRKTRIGPRFLVVTLLKKLEGEEIDQACPISQVKVTVVFDQNYASTGFLAHQKAPVWNRPKVEETVTIHNLPGGIPLDFLKLLIPDALSVEMDEAELKFTREASRVFLGMTRKNTSGGDHILKLFSEVYVNNQFIILTKGFTKPEDVEEMKEILQMKRSEKEEEQKKPVKELVAVPRDINQSVSQASQAFDEGTEIFMQIEDVKEADKVLTGRANGWTGPSTCEQMKQTEISKLSENLTKDPNLSDVSEDLSDISDTSNIGDDPGTKPSPVTGGMLRAKRVYRTVYSSQRRKRSGGSYFDDDRQDLRESAFSKTDTPRFIERMQTGKRYESPSSRSLDRSAHGSQSGRQGKYEREETDCPHKALYRSSNYSPGDFVDVGETRHQKGRLEHYASLTSAEPVMSSSLPEPQRQESARERLRRERQELEKEEKERKLRLAKFKTKNSTALAGDTSHGSLQSSSKGSSRSKSRDRTEVDRHGNVIKKVLLKSREDERQGARSFRRSSPDRTYSRERKGSHSRVTAGGERLEGEALSVLLNRFSRNKQEKLNRYDSYKEHSEERQRGGTRDFGERDERRVVRMGSPLTRRIVRGRSASLKRRASPSCISKSKRHLSPTPIGSQRKITIRQRSVSPHRPTHGSALSPISVGDDNSVGDLQEGMWLSQAPSQSMPRGMRNDAQSHIQTVSGKNTRDDRGINNETPAGSSNSQDWKYCSYSGEQPPQKAPDLSEDIALVKQFVMQVLATSHTLTATHSSPHTASRTQHNTANIEDPVKFLEHLKELSAHGNSSSKDMSSGDGFAASYTGLGGSGGPSTSGSNRKLGFGSESYGSGVEHSRAVEDHLYRKPPAVSQQQQHSNSYNLSLPPPIPPPLFSPSGLSRDRVTEMEALARQLAADIQKQQGQPPPAAQVPQMSHEDFPSTVPSMSVNAPPSYRLPSPALPPHYPSMREPPPLPPPGYHPIHGGPLAPYGGLLPPPHFMPPPRIIPPQDMDLEPPETHLSPHGKFF